jgi:hypothetical protein
MGSFFEMKHSNDQPLYDGTVKSGQSRRQHHQIYGIGASQIVIDPYHNSRCRSSARTPFVVGDFGPEWVTSFQIPVNPTLEARHNFKVYMEKKWLNPGVWGLLSKVRLRHGLAVEVENSH